VFLAASLALKAALDVAYGSVIVGGFGESVGTGDEHIVESYLGFTLVALAAAMHCAAATRPSNVFVALMLSVVMAPLWTLVGAGAPYADSAFVWLLTAGLLTMIAAVNFLPRIDFPQPSALTTTLVWVALALISLYVFGGLILTGGPQRFNLNLFRVYEIRAQLAEAAFPLSGYLISWQGYVIDCALISLGVARRSKILVLIGLVAQLALFGMTNYKSFLFAPLLIVGVYVVYSRRWPEFWLLIGFTAVILAIQAYYLDTDDLTLASLFIRRVFFVTADVHLWYRDFFQQVQNPHLLFTNSIFSSLGEYPYNDVISHIIGDTYAGVGSSANVGFLGDAYAQMGAVGVLVIGVVAGVMWRCGDDLAHTSDRRWATSFLAMACFPLTNSALLTVLLTHGLLLALVVVWIVRSEPRYEATSPQPSTSLRVAI
jgi:hypothetical protein